ncbi:MAG: DUF2752 domain-containing protein [Planctomycetes bacterium]|nr:DUF2752 domain-containing protein [Planctomycetota bacterium]MCB9891152.1 DUF2752 domain-containing protein [Planctomycetota bacterium]MCB9918919.1 DUF2752 domain-containing protein [Planctomycetota bacterium]
MVPAPASLLERVLLAILALAGLALLVWLFVATDPDPRGFGTHEQLGMQPCSWPMLYGEPCPTCGVTTAASLVAHLRPIEAMRVQPFGAVLALGLIVFLIAAGSYAIRGQSLVARVALWPWGWIFLGGVLLLFASWALVRARFTGVAG